MRPLLLEIEGFSVYRKKQTIDFSGLSFFVIQGKTGAGKTSIVDAITYALFGKVPRYQNSTKGVNTKVLSRGADSLRVSLEFMVRNKKYKIERFFSKKAKSIVRLYEDNKRLDLKLKEKEMERFIENLIGVNYDIFTRVILLPQGEFDRFLKPSKPAERREILLKLLGIDFELINKKASEKYKEIEGEYVELLREYESVKGIDPKVIEDMKNEISKLEKEERKIKNDLKNLEREIERAKKYEELVNKFEDAKKGYEELKSREQEISEKENLLKEYKELRPFLPYINMYESLSENLKELRIEKEDLERKYTAIRDELENLSQKLKIHEERKKKIPHLKEKLNLLLIGEEKIKEAMNRMNNIVGLNRKLEELNLKKKENEREIKDTEQRIEKGKSLIDKLKGEIDMLTSYEHIYMEFMKIKSDIEREKELRKKLKEYEYKIKEAESKLKEEKKILRNIKDRLTDLEKELNLYKAYTIREHLKEGDVCPVCGNIYTGKEKEMHVNVDIGKIEGDMEKFKNLEKEKERAIGKIEGTITQIMKEKEKTERELKLIAERIKNTGLSKYKEEELELKIRELKEKRKTLDKYNNRFMELQEKLGRLREETGAIEGDIKRITSLIGEYKEYANSVIDWIKKNSLSKEDTITSMYEDISENIKSVSRKIEEIEKGYEEIRNKAEEKRRLETLFREKLHNINKRIKESEKEQEELAEKLGPLFMKYGNLKELKGKIIDDESAINIEKEINQFKMDIQKLEEIMKETSKEMKNVKTDKDLGQLLAEKEEAEKMLSEIQRRKGELSAKINYTRDILDRKDKMEKRKRELEEKLYIYKRIKDDLRSDKLPHFTSNLMMIKLIDAANAYFYDFTGAYTFEIDESGNLMIVDHTLPTDNMRSVDSLSGGETFIASLCLALGISDILSQNAPLESLFIDEGFGYLDEETREKAWEILGMLKAKVNRMIGIITHIPDLADKFDQKIIVRKKGNTSTVEIVS